jgi:hypothetical protein
MLAVARGWARSGRAVTVMDGDVRHSTLNRILKVGEGEGVTDALRFGASPTLIVRSVPGEPFRFIRAGTAIADPEVLWRDTAGWKRLLARIQSDIGGTLLVFLPEEAGTGVVEVFKSFRIGRGGVSRDDDLPLIHPPGLGAPKLGSTAPDDLTPSGSEDPALEVAPDVAPALDAPAEVAPDVAPTPDIATGGSPTAAPRPDVSPPRAPTVTVPPARARRWTAIYLLVTLFVFLTLAMVVGAQSYGLVDIPGLTFIPRLPLN